MKIQFYFKNIDIISRIYKLNMVIGIFPESKFLNKLFCEWYFTQKSVNPKPFSRTPFNRIDIKVDKL